MEQPNISFIVFEPDPFVCDDIRETLMCAFLASKVSILQDLKQISDAIKAEVGRTIYIFSTSQDADFATVKSQVRGISPQDVVLITQTVDGDAGSPLCGCVSVSKPFKSDMLIDAVRSVLSPPPSSR